MHVLPKSCRGRKVRNVSMQQKGRVRQRARKSGWNAPPLAAAAGVQSLQWRRIRLCSQMELASRIGSLGGSTSPPTACPNTSCVKKGDHRCCSVRTDRLCKLRWISYQSGQGSFQWRFLLPGIRTCKSSDQHCNIARAKNRIRSARTVLCALGTSCPAPTTVVATPHFI